MNPQQRSVNSVNQQNHNQVNQKQQQQQQHLQFQLQQQLHNMQQQHHQQQQHNIHQNPNSSFLTNSLAIRQEIQRFESVHPSIYAIYDLIELIPDIQVAQQIRDHVVCIEDSFVNSQEWTISRSVPDLRLGIVGSLSSGKSALVHRYLTGAYMQEESPEGGRFKKEIFIDNQSYLLLIRDEGGPPELQFASWVDAVIFVFSLENEASFNAIYNYYTKMSHFRNTADIPIILVGTQDAISDRSPRVIDDCRARKLANDLKRCTYFETCATYGLNVERVFQDACQRIVQHRVTGIPPIPVQVNSRPTTPQSTRLGVASYHHSSPPTNGFSTSSPSIVAATGGGITNGSTGGNLTLPHRHHVLSTSSHHIPMRISADFAQTEQQQQNINLNQPPTKWNSAHGGLQQAAMIAITNENNNITKFNPTSLNQNIIMPQHSTGHSQGNSENLAPLSLVPQITTSISSKDTSSGGYGSIKDLPTPTSTPTTSRKSRRRSNLFIPSSKKCDDKIKNGELGSGRSIPLKQGYLYKRSSKSLNKEWKKKYVTLCDDGRLTYHPSLHDYMDDVHGKEIPLQYVTVKVPGQKPRGSKSIITNSALTASMMNGRHQNGLSEGIGCLSIVKDSKKLTEKVLLTAFDNLRDPVKSNSSQQTSGDDEGIAMSNSNSQTFLPSDGPTNNKLDAQTPNVKKRHRRMKSSGIKNNDVDDSDGYEFYIVSLDSKQWHFEAANSEERDEWVTAIEQEIFKSLQSIESSKTKPATSSELASMASIRSRVPGNLFCVDCDAPNPEWASLNLGVLMCIECSGIHRNLGSHISKVRSLDLDDWPPSHLSVILAIGNNVANSVWEANIARNCVKPIPNSTRDEKESWIRSKYEGKEFLPICSNQTTPIGQQLIEAVVKSDIKAIILILARNSIESANATVSPRDLRTPLHLACATGNLAIAQLLIWNNANIKKTDHEGRTCLAYAKAAASLAEAKSRQQNNSIASSNTTLSSNASNSSTGSTTSSTVPPTTTLPQYSVEETTALVELLTGLGCPDSAPLTGSGTLPRRRDTLGTPYEKLPSGVI